MGLTGPDEDPAESAVQKRMIEEVVVQIEHGKYMCALNLYKISGRDFVLYCISPSTL